MREIEAPFVDKIKLPKMPKRREIIIKVNDLRKLLSMAGQLDFPRLLKIWLDGYTKAILEELMATGDFKSISQLLQLRVYKF